MAEEASQWRRAGPLPPADPPARRGPPGGGDRPSYNRFESSASTGGGFDAMEVGAGGRSGFGSKFTPAPAGVRDAPPHGAPRTPRVGADGGPPPPLEPSQGDEASNWRTGKPVETPVEARRPSSGVTPGGADRAQSFRGGDATQVDERYAGQERMGFGSKFAATPPESPSGGAGKRAGFGFAAGRAGPPGAPGAGPSAAPVTPTAGDEADTWRNAARRPAPARGPSQGPAAGAPPAERKKLELKPRSTPTPAAEGGEAPSTPLSPTGEQSSSGRANPFGNAKPVDAAERERLIEEKMAAREKERKEQREKEQAERIAERQAAQDAAPKGPRGDRNKPAGAAAEGGAASPAPAGAPTGPRASGSAGNAWRREPSASSPSVPAGPAADAKKTSAPSSEKGSSQAEAVASPPAPAAAAAAPVAPPKPAPTGAWGGGRKPSGALNLPSGATSPAAGSGSATPAAQEKGEAEKSEAASEVQAATEGVAAASLDEKSA
jgi:translation initiation factor 4B